MNTSPLKKIGVGIATSIICVGAFAATYGLGRINGMHESDFVLRKELANCGKKLDMVVAKRNKQIVVNVRGCKNGDYEILINKQEILQ